MNVEQSIDQQKSDYLSAFDRLITGLKEDQDDTQVFESLRKVLDNQPSLLVPILNESVRIAEDQLGQIRKGGSSATLLYPIEAAIKYVGKQQEYFTDGRDPLSASSWTTTDIRRMLFEFGSQIAEVAGTNTTAKNLPQRAMQILWLLDQVPTLNEGQDVTFIEIGASNGLVLDALRQPQFFRKWFGQTPSYDESQQVVYGWKLKAPNYQGIGIDLASPDIDWARANILDSTIRSEVDDFLEQVPNRSPIIQADASDITQIPEVIDMIGSKDGTLPIVVSCFMLYQLPPDVRAAAEANVRKLLQASDGGLFVKTDIAKYMGVPELAGGAVSWVENEAGEVVSPKIVLSGKTISQWKELNS